MGALLLLAVLVAAALAAFLPSDQLIAGLPAGAVIAQSAFALIAVSLLASLVHRYRGRLAAGLRDALLWLLIFAGTITAYAYRDLLEPIRSRVMAEILPGTVVTSEPGVAEVVRRRDGHFVLDMKANGIPMSFMFDTGATTVVLRAQDARRLGFDIDKLAFNAVVSTANGVSRAATVKIDRLSAGPITVRNVAAMVARPGALEENLLGQSFLEKLSGYSVMHDRLVMRGP